MWCEDGSLGGRHGDLCFEAAATASTWEAVTAASARGRRGGLYLSGRHGGLCLEAAATAST